MANESDDKARVAFALTEQLLVDTKGLVRPAGLRPTALPAEIPPADLTHLEIPTVATAHLDLQVSIGLQERLFSMEHHVLDELFANFENSWAKMVEEAQPWAGRISDYEYNVSYRFVGIGSSLQLVELEFAR